MADNLLITGQTDTKDEADNKRLLDEVSVISRIIKAKVRVISQSRRLRPITLTETLIILDITKTESNNCFIIRWTQKLGSHVSASSLTASSTNRAKLTWLPLEIIHDVITRNLESPWHDNCIICSYDVTALISKIHCTLSANQKRVCIIASLIASCNRNALSRKCDYKLVPMTLMYAKIQLYPRGKNQTHVQRLC